MRYSLSTPQTRRVVISIETDRGLLVDSMHGETIAKVSHRRVLVDRSRFLQKLSATPAPA